MSARHRRVVGAPERLAPGHPGRPRRAPSADASTGSPRRARRMSAWYSSLGISSMRRRRVSPPAPVEGGLRGGGRTWPPAPASPRPANICSRRRMRMPGTTRSRLCRLRSTSTVTLPSPGSGSSSTASQTLPSSSSASPTVATNRRSGHAAASSARCGRAGTGPRAPRTSARPRPGPPTRSRSRPGRGPWSATGTTGGRRTAGAASATRASRSPMRYRSEW